MPKNGGVKMIEKMVKIKEQTIEDLASGLEIEFKTREDGEFRLILKGSTLPFGNREIHFDKDGQYIGAGVWLEE